ncbi:uncharacterized protein LOC119836244 [Zerene cesonia]|uniref:uncharacterized protein LOC119836244 n=1 Tax=Zerene cesonia TaxID=33412 RepID=UPI0018E532FC|nr:uncharacterized protein LOC119836244 [Zerene cesonia]
MTDSDSSEGEDLSRFKEAVDTNFVNLINQKVHSSKSSIHPTETKQKSERYLEETSHYNDVKVPLELQKRIGDKISSIINKNIQFVDIDPKKHKRKIKGGVKLFKDSEDFLSCNEDEDTYTESHNKEAKKLKQERTKEDVDEDQLKSVVVSGEYVLSKEETKYWKSRRKEKVFKYKSNGKGLLVAVE